MFTVVPARHVYERHSVSSILAEQQSEGHYESNAVCKHNVFADILCSEAVYFLNEPIVTFINGSKSFLRWVVGVQCAPMSHHRPKFDYRVCV